jgi:hypothetical protein
VPAHAFPERLARALRTVMKYAAWRWGTTWRGQAASTPLALFRVGLALLVLVRTTHWLRPWIALDHFMWTRGPEYSPALEAVREPHLFSPLLPLPDLATSSVELLVSARTGLALALLLGLWPRLSALGLFVIGYGLMALDRYRYFHHMHLLWLSCLWLALLPTPRRGLLAALRSGAERVPRWPLQLLRAQAIIVYVAAGVAKLQPTFLSGQALEATARAGLVGGPLWSAASQLLGTSVLAGLIAFGELSIAACLVYRPLRPLGIALGIALHVGLQESMVVSTFGAQMALYLMLFLRWDPPAAGS